MISIEKLTELIQRPTAKVIGRNVENFMAYMDQQAMILAKGKPNCLDIDLKIQVICVEGAVTVAVRQCKWKAPVIKGEDRDIVSEAYDPKNPYLPGFDEDETEETTEEEDNSETAEGADEDNADEEEICIEEEENCADARENCADANIEPKNEDGNEIWTLNSEGNPQRVVGPNEVSAGREFSPGRLVLKPGDEIWVMSSSGRPRRVTVLNEGNEEDGFALRSLEGRCYRLTHNSKHYQCFASREEAEAVGREMRGSHEEE